MADIQALQAMMESLESQIRQRLVAEVEEFVGQYHFHYGSEDVVLVAQLMDYLRAPHDQR